jgi:hypothetical protein
LQSCRRKCGPEFVLGIRLLDSFHLELQRIHLLPHLCHKEMFWLFWNTQRKEEKFTFNMEKKKRQQSRRTKK